MPPPRPGALVEEGVDALTVSLCGRCATTRTSSGWRSSSGSVTQSSSSPPPPRCSAHVGEYERTMTGVINSYIGPLMNAYVEAIEPGARERGYAGG